MASKRGVSGNAAELLLQKWLESCGYLVHRAARAGFVRLSNGVCLSKSYDVFGCLDFLALPRVDAPDAGGVWAIQVTTQKGRSPRRKKILEHLAYWPSAWRISIVSQETIPNPANLAKRLYFWRVEDLDTDMGMWGKPTAIPFTLPKGPTRARTRKNATGAVPASGQSATGPLGVGEQA